VKLLHEWALAESVVNTVLKYKEEKNLVKVNKVLVKIGKLQQIELDVFNSALDDISKMKNIEGKFVVEEEDVSFKCRVCGSEWDFEKGVKELDEDEAEYVHFIPDIIRVYSKCPKCGSPDFEVLKGRGVWIEYIEGESP
jgi:hydrogenase nickel incorporation protein HypA/HybF